MPSPKRVVNEAQQPKVSARDKLLSKAGKKSETAANKKSERPIINLGDAQTRDIATAVDRLTACVHMKKAVDGHEKAARRIVMPFGQHKTLELWIKNGNRTENIKLQTPAGASFILQAKDTITGVRGVRLPKNEDGEPIDVETHLGNHNVPAQLITRLMEEGEFVDEQVMTIPMVKLEKENKPLADRLIELIVAANDGGVTTKDGKKIKFTDEELSQLVEGAHDVTVKEGFLDRIVPHVRNAISGDEQQIVALSAVLDAIPPQWAVGSATQGINEKEIIGTILHKEPEQVTTPQAPVDHAAGNYTLRVTGLNIEIIRNSDKKPLATKKCKDGGHLENTIKKWQREPTALAEYISNNV